MEEKQSFTIKNWSDDDKPREKLLLKGQTALSDAELVAILIGSGSRNESAVALCKRILASVDNNLNQLGKLSVQQLSQFKGIGEAKAITIVAALEISRRRRAEETVEIEKINSAKKIFEIMQPIIGELPHEEFWVIYVNNSSKILHKAQISKGGITGTLVDVRLIFKLALEHHATSIFLIHNHPSGKLEPSQADIEITNKIKEAGKILTVQVLDHVIVTEHDYISFADEDWFINPIDN